MAALAGRFRVIRYDSRGHGQSNGDAGALFDRAARPATRSACSTRSRSPRAHFCGLSMGGMVGMWLGINAPQRDRPAGARQHRGEDRHRRKCGTRGSTPCARAAWPSIAPAVLARWFTPALLERAHADDREDARDVRAHVGRRLRGLVRGRARHGPARTCSSRIRAPTLVIARHATTVATPADDGRFLGRARFRARATSSCRPRTCPISRQRRHSRRRSMQFLTGRTE